MRRILTLNRHGQPGILTQIVPLSAKTSSLETVGKEWIACKGMSSTTNASTQMAGIFLLMSHNPHRPYRYQYLHPERAHLTLVCKYLYCCRLHFTSILLFPVHFLTYLSISLARTPIARSVTGRDEDLPTSSQSGTPERLDRSTNGHTVGGGDVIKKPCSQWMRSGRCIRGFACRLLHPGEDGLDPRQLEQDDAKVGKNLNPFQKRLFTDVIRTSLPR